MTTLHYFEIPVEDMDRAKAFYEAVLDGSITVTDFRETMGTLVGGLPHRGGAGGALVWGPQQGYIPGERGTLIYLVLSIPVEEALTHAKAHGGEIMLDKTPLPEGAGGGFVAWVKDSEGNKIGLYASQ